MFPLKKLIAYMLLYSQVNFQKMFNVGEKSLTIFIMKRNFLGINIF